MTDLGKVLLVDDDTISNFISARTLQAANVTAQISVANDGFEALELVQQALFDLILLDLKMPNMDGFEFLDALRQLQEGAGTSAPAIVILTSSESPADKAKAAQYPMVKGYLTKPLKREHVNQVVNWLSEAAF